MEAWFYCFPVEATFVAICRISGPLGMPQETTPLKCRIMPHNTSLHGLIGLRIEGRKGGFLGDPRGAAAQNHLSV
jgi:hypothetical protein